MYNTKFPPKLSLERPTSIANNMTVGVTEQCGKENTSDFWALLANPSEPPDTIMVSSQNGACGDQVIGRVLTWVYFTVSGSDRIEGWSYGHFLTHQIHYRKKHIQDMEESPCWFPDPLSKCYFSTKSQIETLKTDHPTPPPSPQPFSPLPNQKQSHISR